MSTPVNSFPLRGGLGRFCTLAPSVVREALLQRALLNGSKMRKKTFPSPQARKMAQIQSVVNYAFSFGIKQ